MSKHTPGPWTQHAADSLEIAHMEYGGIARVFEPEPYGNRRNADMEIAEANARLIAASPGLLAAGEAMVGELRHNPQWADHVRHGKIAISVDADAIDAMLAAIAKATEGQS